MKKVLENSITTAKIKHGGFRAGSGRKPKLQYEARELLNMAIDERLPKMFEKIDDLIEKGDPTILKMLIEQRFGRPSVPETPRISQPKRIPSEIYNNPKVQEKVDALNRELKLALYGEPPKNEDGTVAPWPF
jgi:hypothetical protein